MLFELERIDDLASYIRTSNDKVLLKWWAQYLESNGKFDAALQARRPPADV